MFAHSSATTVAASISAAPPVSVLRKSLTGAARLRPQAVRSENGSVRRWAFMAGAPRPRVRAKTSCARSFSAPMPSAPPRRCRHASQRGDR